MRRINLNNLPGIDDKLDILKEANARLESLNLQRALEGQPCVPSVELIRDSFRERVAEMSFADEVRFLAGETPSRPGETLGAARAAELAALPLQESELVEAYSRVPIQPSNELVEGLHFPPEGNDIDVVYTGVPVAPEPPAQVLTMKEMMAPFLHRYGMNPRRPIEEPPLDPLIELPITVETVSPVITTVLDLFFG